MFGWINVLAVRSLRRELADERTAHDITRRQLRCAEAETESLASVIARDRARVEAETSVFTRQQAENEGTNVRTR